MQIGELLTDTQPDRRRGRGTAITTTSVAFCVFFVGHVKRSSCSRHVPGLFRGNQRIEWYAPPPIDITSNALLTHSPASQKICELESFVESDLSRYADLRKSFAFDCVDEQRVLPILRRRRRAALGPQPRQRRHRRGARRRARGTAGLLHRHPRGAHARRGVSARRPRGALCLCAAGGRRELEIALFERREDYTYGALTMREPARPCAASNSKSTTA